MDQHVSNKMQQVESGRAAFAYEQVEQFVAERKGRRAQDVTTYANYLKKLPMMIQVNGLGQAMAFYYAKGDIYRSIYDQIQAWMKQEISSCLSRDKNEPLIKRIVMAPSPEYRQATREITALVTWMARFADGLNVMPKQVIKDGGAE